MGLFRFAGGALISMVLAPVTGGTSLLAVGALGGLAAHTLGAAQDEEEKAAARHEGEKQGYDNGYRAGNIDAAKRFATALQNNDNLRFGAFALGLHIAALDGEIHDDEITTINNTLGSPDSSIYKPYVKAELKKIIDTRPGFSVIIHQYIGSLDFDTLLLLDEFVQEVINADGYVDASEKEFYEDEWEPFMASRMQNYQ